MLLHREVCQFTRRNYLLALSLPPYLKQQNIPSLFHTQPEREGSCIVPLPLPFSQPRPRLAAFTTMPLAPPSSSPPTHNDASLARRRSISRASGSLSSYRSSLGGKAIGPKYGSSASGALRRGAEGSSSSAEQGTNINSSSALSEGNSDFDGSDGGFAARFGSFSATREELRDGECFERRRRDCRLRSTRCEVGRKQQEMYWCPIPFKLSRMASASRTASLI